MDWDTCIYCESNGPFNSQEHVFPANLGCNLVLPYGYVCDRSNHNFSSLDKAVLCNRAIAMYVGTSGMPGRKGKPRREISNMKFAGGGQFSIAFEPIDIEPRDLRGRKYTTRLAQGPEFDEAKFCRGIYKIAFNSMVYFLGPKSALSPFFRQAREYVHHGQTNEIRPYLVRGNSSGQLTANGFLVDGIHLVELQLLALDIVVCLDNDVRKAEKYYAGYVCVRDIPMWDQSSILGLRC